MNHGVAALLSTVFTILCGHSVALEVTSQSVSAAKLTVSSSLGLRQTAVPPFPAYGPAPSPSTAPQQFWAGACIGSMLRLEALPDRTFYAEDGITVLHPIDALVEAGFNAVRVQTYRNMSSDPTLSFNNSGDVLSRELNYLLDTGNIDIAVLTAGLAKERNMKIVLTINMGNDIPPAWQQYNFSQMLGAIDQEVRRQLMPFLQAGIQPDIILLENEGSVGFLYTVVLANGTQHDRGTSGQASNSQLEHELCGKIPTGHINSWPSLASYYKREILTCRDAMQKAGFDPAFTRFGLHDQQKYAELKQSIVYNTSNPDVESVVTVNGTSCSLRGIVPENILDLRASDLLDIIGFSSYPAQPENISSIISMNATFSAVRQTLSYMDSIVTRYGRYTSGPFSGQFQKQGLAVEYASQFPFPNGIKYQQQHTQLYFQTLQTRPWFLGALWYEPTWAYAKFEGGDGSLYHKWSSYKGNGTNEAPTSTLPYWGSFARSP